MPRTTFSQNELDLLTQTRVGRLATADQSGQPHVIPIVFATDGERLYTPLDRKPKRVGSMELKRVRNLVENPRVAVVVDHYEEDWSKLTWLLVKGTGTLVESGEEYDVGVQLLEKKYPQYERMRLQGQPLIVITPFDITSWKAN
jgi:PPOX class probable F420-dependent enzyme